MTNTNPTARIAFYPRVSRTGKRTREELERHTIARQRELALSIVPQNAELVDDERYYDLNVSGKHSERPGLRALFDDVESGLIDGVVVGYLSRFGRNTRELLENVEYLHEHDATLYIGDEQLIAKPGRDTIGRLLLTIIAAVNAMQVDQLADGLADSNARAIADGKSTTIPYGFMREDGPGSVLVFDLRDDFGPSPASVVRRIFALRLDELGASAIANLLNAEGVPSPSQYAEHRGRRVKQIGSRWTHRSVRAILETHTYRGVIPRWQTEPVPDSKTKRRRIPGTLELLPADHDALIDESTWKRAQINGERRPRTGANGRALLQSLVRCSSCSQTMRPTMSNATNLIYQCRGRKSGCTHPASITRRYVDEYVEQRVLDALGNGGYGVAVIDPTELDDLIAKIDDASDELVAFRDGADARDPDYWPGVRARRARIDELEREQAELARQTSSSPAPTPDVYRTLDVDERREVLSDLLDAVVIHPAPGRGRMGLIDERVAAIVPFGQSPIELGRSGVPMPPRPFPLVEAD